MQFKMLSSQFHRNLKLLVVCLTVILAISFTVVAGAEAASENLEITVYRDPFCSCCSGWIEHLTVQGFKTTNVITSDMDTLKQQYGVSNNLASCHTAVIDGYVIEGHVPANDIKQLVAARADVAGLTVPGMPVGTPGMESENVRESFTVFSFNKQGIVKTFNHYL